MTQYEKEIIRANILQFKDAIKLLETMGAPAGLLDPYHSAVKKTEGLIKRSRYRRTAVRMTSPHHRVFASATEACQALSISNSTLSMHLNHPLRYPHANGYVFERVTEDGE